MPQLIIIFLLMFAILAFGWFYWQRAKSRGSDADVPTSDPVEPPDSTPAS